MRRKGFFMGGIAIALIAFVAGILLGWMANGLVAQDRCLDQGGMWNSKNRTCIESPAG